MDETQVAPRTIQSVRHTYRHRMVPLASLFYVVFAYLLVPSLNFNLDVGLSYVGLVTGWILAWPLLAFIFLRLVEHFVPIQLSPLVLRTYNSFGMRIEVPWNAITRTSYIAIWPGLGWIVLDDGKSFVKRGLIPCFMRDKEVFFRDVVEVIGDDHLLTAVLRKRRFTV